jgi:LCP family protein required for cell wall assembly
VSLAAPPRAPQATPAGGPSPGPGDPAPVEIRRRRTWWRVALGCLIVLLASAATSAVFVSGEVRTLRDALSQNQSLDLAPGTLASAGFGDPETILLVGNDQRNHTTTTPVLPHSNEMLLVRFDPSKPYISMMSIPRELEVTIRPPHSPAVTTRLNYAYTAGGIPLLVSTIRQVTGVAVNHVVVIDFNQFKRAIDQMGCVYSTVDRRYYHVNVPGGPQYQEINLQPGYQRMCGEQALEFVSYRHDDTSLVRDARDQSFLLDVKKQYGPTLVSNVHTFEQIFGRLVQTDSGLHSTGGILDLIGTLISSSSLRVRQVQFQVNLQPAGATPCACDTASPQQIGASVHSFLFGSSAPPKQRTAAVAKAVHHRQPPASLPLVPTAPAAVALARSHGARLSFPLEFPRVQDRGGSVIAASLRNYLLYPSPRTTYESYAAVFSAGQLGQYYDVQGSQWTTAPQFASPDQSVQVGGRTYELYYQGQHLQTVAWFEHGAVYWIHNSLLDSLGNGEMLAMAEQTMPLTSGTGSPPRRVTLGSTPLPIRPSALTNLSTRELVGSLGGLVTLLAVPLLAIPLLRRWRDLQNLRATLQGNLEREARLGARLGALPVGAAPCGGRPRAPGHAAAPADDRLHPFRIAVPHPGADPARRGDPGRRGGSSFRADPAGPPSGLPGQRRVGQAGGPSGARGERPQRRIGPGCGGQNGDATPLTGSEDRRRRRLQRRPTPARDRNRVRGGGEGGGDQAGAPAGGERACDRAGGSGHPGGRGGAGSARGHHSLEVLSRHARLTRTTGRTGWVSRRRWRRRSPGWREAPPPPRH